MESLTSGVSDLWTDVLRVIYDATIRLALPIALVALTPVVFVLLRDFDVRVLDLQGAAIALGVCAATVGAVVALRARFASRTAWGSDIAVAILVLANLAATSAEGAVSLIKLVLVAYGIGGLVADAAFRGRKDRVQAQHLERAQ